MEQYLKKKCKLVFQDGQYEVAKIGILISVSDHVLCFLPDGGSEFCIGLRQLIKLVPYINGVSVEGRK